MDELNFRDVFFHDIVNAKLGYKPSIVVAPSHMANGLFREIGGGYFNNEAQHRAVYAGTNPIPKEDDKAYKKFEDYSDTQKAGLSFLQKHPTQRQIISDALRADRTAFTNVSQSSYSLTHHQHTTNDNHDREVGRWLTRILEQGDERPGYDLLHTLLTQGIKRGKDQPPAISDAPSLMTLPLMHAKQDAEDGTLWLLDKAEMKTKEADQMPTFLTMGADSTFSEPLLTEIRCAFDQLAANDKTSAIKNGKADALRRMVTLACFTFYLHLINIGNAAGEKLPLLLYLDRESRTLKRSSQATYQLVRQSADRFLHQAISERINQLNETGEYGRWDSDAAIYQHIGDLGTVGTINWYRTKSEKARAKELGKVTKLQEDCRNFYDSYRNSTSNYTPTEAAARAFTDIISMVFSETPSSVARSLGVKIGLLTRGNRRSNKAYELHPDLLEVLVRATLPIGEEWTLKELATAWQKRFGILFGGVGDDNAQLAQWQIAPVDTNELNRNRRALAQQLEMSGYAQSYADGVVMVRVGR